MSLELSWQVTKGNLWVALPPLGSPHAHPQMGWTAAALARTTM